MGCNITWVSRWSGDQGDAATWQKLDGLFRRHTDMLLAWLFLPALCAQFGCGSPFRAFPVGRSRHAGAELGSSALTMELIYETLPPRVSLASGSA